MGILNATPDSFSDAGLYQKPASALRKIDKMIKEGASIIDIGGESTRPGSKPVSKEEEIERVIPIIRASVKRFKVPISIDTSKAEVARIAIEEGACLVNDVSALRADEKMGNVVARSRVSLILMHMRGTPRNMQHNPRYKDVVLEVRRFLSGSIRLAEGFGISRDKILLDPGIGFGKTVAHNLLLIKHIDRILELGRPVVIGPSRKSFIGRILDTDVQERLYGTLACVAQAASKGVHMIRVHDVKPAADFLRLWHSIDRGEVVK
jgi:dihydropteroate synthase